MVHVLVEYEDSKHKHDFVITEPSVGNVHGLIMAVKQLLSLRDVDRDRFEVKDITGEVIEDEVRVDELGIGHHPNAPICIRVRKEQARLTSAP